MNSNKVRVANNIVSAIMVVAIFFLSFVSLINFTYNSIYIETHVKGFSMRPTINNNVQLSTESGDKIYINTYAKFDRNDIVVAAVPWHTDYIIKRVVGTPGDKVQIRDEETHFAVYVNNELLYTKDKYGENYLDFKTGSYSYYNNYLKFLENPNYNNFENQNPNSIDDYTSIKEDENGKFIKLGKNDYLLLGDNWGHTTDSIEKGPIKSSELVGVVDCIIDITNDDPFAEFRFFLKKLFS